MEQTIEKVIKEMEKAHNCKIAIYEEDGKWCITIINANNILDMRIVSLCDVNVCKYELASCIRKAFKEE